MRAARASTGSWVLFMHQREEERIDIARRFSRKLDFLFTDELWTRESSMRRPRSRFFSAPPLFRSVCSHRLDSRSIFLSFWATGWWRGRRHCCLRKRHVAWFSLEIRDRFVSRIDMIVFVGFRELPHDFRTRREDMIAEDFLYNISV